MLKLVVPVLGFALLLVPFICRPFPVLELLQFIVYREFQLLLFAISIFLACFSQLYFGGPSPSAYQTHDLLEFKFKVKLNFFKKRSEPF